jgi:hypothetical protein
VAEDGQEPDSLTSAQFRETGAGAKSIRPFSISLAFSAPNKLTGNGAPHPIRLHYDA